MNAVTEEEIRAGIALLAESTGIFTESAGGVTIATLAKLAAQGAFRDQQQVVAVITGDGLKTPRVLKPQSQSWEEFNWPQPKRRLVRDQVAVA